MRPARRSGIEIKQPLLKSGDIPATGFTGECSTLVEPLYNGSHGRIVLSTIFSSPETHSALTAPAGGFFDFPPRNYPS
jgi:hypothetical protein